MFTGIIKETGKIIKINDKTSDREVKIQCARILKDLNTGDSISINGVCLTATDIRKDGFSCDVSFNTLSNTSLKYLKVGDMVNLENSLTPTDKLGGHFVYGHVDCASKILEISKIGRSHIIKIELPSNIREFIALKGSVAIDGISLTISEVKIDSFSVVIIPYTFENTNLSDKHPGDIINIEVDMLVRYVVNFLKSGGMENINYQQIKDKILNEKLKKYGFTE